MFLFLVLTPARLAVADPVDSVSPAAAPKKAPAEKPVMVRLGDLPNPILDERCSAFRGARFQQDKNARLPGVFAVHFPGAELSYCWDPVECRLLYVWRKGFLKNDSILEGELAYVAEGPAPLAASTGAFGAPDFFGFRMVDGVPEFLYTCGLLSVAERIEVTENGKALAQRFSVQNTPFEVTLAIPERWKDLVRPSQGTWAGGFVTIPRDAIGDFRLHYSLEKTPELPELRKDWNLAESRPVAMGPPPPAGEPPAPRGTAIAGPRPESGPGAEKASKP